MINLLVDNALILFLCTAVISDGMLIMFRAVNTTQCTKIHEQKINCNTVSDCRSRNCFKINSFGPFKNYYVNFYCCLSFIILIIDVVESKRRWESPPKGLMKNPPAFNPRLLVNIEVKSELKAVLKVTRTGRPRNRQAAPVQPSFRMQNALLPPCVPPRPAFRWQST